jgi:uncharacterized membrane protein YqjE
MSAAPAEGGFVAALRRVVATLLALIATRVELLSVDIEEGLWHAAGVMLLVASALCLGFLALLMLAVTVVIAFWDDHRLLAAGLVTLFFALAALGAGLAARSRLARRPRFLAASLDELEADSAALDEPPR